MNSKLDDIYDALGICPNEAIMPAGELRLRLTKSFKALMLELIEPYHGHTHDADVVVYGLKEDINNL